MCGNSSVLAHAWRRCLHPTAAIRCVCADAVCYPYHTHRPCSPQQRQMKPGALWWQTCSSWCRRCVCLGGGQFDWLMRRRVDSTQAPIRWCRTDAGLAYSSRLGSFPLWPPH